MKDLIAQSLLINLLVRFYRLKWENVKHNFRSTMTALVLITCANFKRYFPVYVNKICRSKDYFYEAQSSRSLISCNGKPRTQ